MKLSAKQCCLRLAILILIGMGAVVLRSIDPAIVPWRPACGAITGLPCLFCGTTRAFHHLLNGQLGQALYFNWMVFPLALAGAVVFVAASLELTLQRRLFLRPLSFQFTPKIAILSATAVIVLWILQVSLAVSLHKDELFNPHGVLYGLLVR